MSDDQALTAKPATRGLVALDGGPKHGQWFWADDWTRLRDSVAAQRMPPGHPLNAAPHYQPTGHHIDNPSTKYGRGEVWRYTPPAEQWTEPPVIAAVRPPPECTACGNPLLLARSGRDRCARCHPAHHWWATVPAVTTGHHREDAA